LGSDLGSDSGSDSAVLICPPARLLVAKSMKERRISLRCLQFTEKDTLLVPHIHKFRKLRNSSPTHTTTIAQLKVIQSCCTVLKDTTEMGILMADCTLAYTMTGRLVGCVAHILTMHCQMIYKKTSAKKLWQMNNCTPCFFTQNFPYHMAISKCKKILVFFPEEV